MQLFALSLQLQVTYDSNHVDLGNVLTPTQVQHQPTLKWPADGNSLYTLIMTGKPN